MKKCVFIITSIIISLSFFSGCGIFNKTSESKSRIELETIHPVLGLSETEASILYNQIVDSAMDNPHKADYQALRMAHAGTSDYQPYSDNETLSKIKKLLDNEKYVVASEVVKTVYHSLFHVPMYHFYAYVAWRENGDDKMASIHSVYFKKLIDSILESGDGKSAETAYIVINVTEEYRTLEYLDLEMEKQSLVKENGRHYDVMEVRDTLGNKKSVYFNIDIPFRELQNSQ
ncbi:MAG: DUF4919 domain-containing protein [Bacteroidales bacterium]